MILETSYLIDLEREARRGHAGPASRLLEEAGDASLYVTFTVAGELAAGASLRDRKHWEEFLAPFRVLESNRDVAWHYGEITRFLRSNGLLIGANDLWIAATALAYGLPLATANGEHFRRVPGLRVVEHREA